MQTIPTSTVSGATQVPILRREDLLLGDLLTGPAWLTLRRLLTFCTAEGADSPTGTHVLLQDVLMHPPDAGHVHAFTRHGGRECACGIYRVEVASILPQDPRVARTYAVRPRREATTPSAFTVYITPEGTPVEVDATGNWSGVPAMPIVPKLHQVWSLPPTLHRFVRRETQE